MKNLMLRSGALLACVLSLASCGGGDGNLNLEGFVTNMTKAGLTLSNNGGPAIDIPAGQPGGRQFFRFSGLEADDRFNIQVVNQPEGSACVGTNNVGKMGGYSVQNVQFTCYNLPQDLKGTVSPALNYAIVLNNGKDQIKVPAGQTTFNFTTKNEAGVTVGTVGHGEPFGVTVLEPTDANCTVENGTGTMAKGYDQVVVKCLKK